MAIKVLTTADIHLGKRSSGLPERSEWSSTRYTWNSIVEWALHNDADILLLAGDIVDRDNRYFEAVGPLQSGFQKLKDADIKVFITAGNHDFDVLPQIAANSRHENVQLLGKNGEWQSARFQKNGLNLSFYGWSFPTRIVYTDPLSNFRPEEINPNDINIGVLHGELDTVESRYAPVDSRSLKAKNLDVWVLGHIHKPRQVQDHEPAIFYPGSPHALSAKEPGKHGPQLLTINGKENITITPIPLSPVRYERLQLNVAEADSEETLREKLTSDIVDDAEEKLAELNQVENLIYDLYLDGRHRDHEDMNSWVAPMTGDYEREIGGGTRISVRKVTNDVGAAVENLEELVNDPSPAGKLAETILAIENGTATEFLNKLLDQWRLKHEGLNKSDTYAPLSNEERVQEREAEDFILRECNQLLGELLTQQNQQ